MDVKEEKPLLCNICCKAFMTLDEFNAHGKTKHQKAIASLCSGEANPSETCQGNDMFMNIIEQDKKPEVCDECGEAFMDSDSFIAHKEEHRNEQFFVCAECKRIFTVEEDLDRHLEKHSVTSSALMNNVRSDCSDPKLLQTIKILHQNANRPNAIPFKSQFTFCTSERKDEINTEPKPSDDIAGKLCQYNNCVKLFPQRLEWTYKIRHNDLTTSKEQKPSHLDQYSKAFAKHLKSHSARKDYQFNQCDKAVGGQLDLTQHLATSRGEKSHQCDQCGKTFKRKDNLIVHFRTHSGEKPFRCDQCNKAFTVKSYLTKHLRTHSGEKPFRCDQCDKAFTDKCSMTNHLRTHSGEKPHQCYQCDKAFARKSHLRRHLRTQWRECIPM